MSKDERTSQSAESANEGFFAKLFGFFFKSSDPEWEKKKLLRDIAKTLNKQRFKFYKPRSGETLPSFAKFFYQIYKTVGPTASLLANADASNVLKTIIIESHLSEQILEIKHSFEEEAIRKKADETDLNRMAKDTKDNLVTFFAAFDNDRVNQINESFNLLTLFLQFINFDYYFLLKKFDSRLPENDFIYNPRFENISGEYIAEDIKDFLSIIPLLSTDQNWDRLFDILGEYKGQSIITPQSWKKIIKGIEDVHKSRILELIVKHIDSDPFLAIKSYPPSEAIVEEYLNKIKTQAELTIQMIIRDRQSRKIEQLLNQIFGTTIITRTKYYTEKYNMTFSKRMLGGFIHVAPVNYLKAFLLDYFKKDIREVVDLLLIKGKWTTNIMSQQLSESFNKLMEISISLVQFDDNLSEEGELGAHLRVIIKKADRDTNGATILRKVLKDINDKALMMVNESAHSLITMGKSLKQVIDDYDRKNHEILINWKEITTASDSEIKQHMITVYKKIYYFIQLMQHYVKSK